MSDNQTMNKGQTWHAGDRQQEEENDVNNYRSSTPIDYEKLNMHWIPKILVIQEGFFGLSAFAVVIHIPLYKEGTARMQVQKTGGRLVDVDFHPGSVILIRDNSALRVTGTGKLVQLVLNSGRWQGSVHEAKHGRIVDLPLDLRRSMGFA